MARSDEIFKMLSRSVNSVNESGFLAPEDEFEAALQAKLDEYLAEIPASEEMFNADLARRGIFGSGEAPKALYRDVYAPVARAGTSAIAQSKLAYQQMQQRGRIQAEGFRQQGYNRLASIYGQQLQMENQAPWWGELLGTGIGLASLPFIDKFLSEGD